MRATRGTATALAGLIALVASAGVVGGSWALRGDDDRPEPVEVATRPDGPGATESADEVGVAGAWPRWVLVELPAPTTTTVAPTTTAPAAPPSTEAAAAPSRPRRSGAPSTTSAPAPTAPAPTAPPAPAPPPPPAVPPVGSAAEQAMLAAVNAQRAAGRSCGGTWHAATHPLALSGALGQAATAHAQDMRDRGFFSHTGSDGSDAGTRMLRAGYAWRAWGENIAAGQRTGAEAIAGWFDSPGHCANFMSPLFTQVGFGTASGSGSPYGTYWAAALGAPR